MRTQRDQGRAERIGRIQDKTPWTKALGGAAMVVYGDSNRGREANRLRCAGDRMMNERGSG